MPDQFPEKPDYRRLAMYILLLLASLSVLILSMFGILEEPEKQEGIVVRFILFIKQSSLI